MEKLLFRRPRLLNVLHWANLIDATSQTITAELHTLERYARGARQALEIGTYQGVSAVAIATALAPGGCLYCVDPWPDTSGGQNNPCWLICQRHLTRSGVSNRIRFLRGYSHEMVGQMPKELDFAFIDGDHSWEGIHNDWMIVSEKLLPGAVVCLHDSVTPAGEEWRHLDSCRYFEERIRHDYRFSVIEVVHSLAVLRKNN
jgi:predicted O-methyltransferase YrrM